MIASRLRQAIDRINWAVELHRPVAVFGLFSGGHDSLSAMYATRETGAMSSIVHINTGIGVPATREFVRDTSSRLGSELIELKAAENTNAKGEPDPQLYRSFVLKYGFPGPHGHNMMYARLKERALARLARMFGATTRKTDKRRIMLVAGCRSQESIRRMGNVEPIQVDGRFIWVNPIHDWLKSHTSDLIQHAKLERNIVVDLIHKSGECLCGAFAKPGELEELKLWPQTRPAYDQLVALQKEAEAAGVHAKWGQRPPRKCDKRQATLPLCWSCDKGQNQ